MNTNLSNLWAIENGSSMLTQFYWNSEVINKNIVDIGLAKHSKDKRKYEKKRTHMGSLLTACSHNWKQQKTTADKDSFNLLQLILKYVRHSWSQSHILKLCLKWTKKNQVLKSFEISFCLEVALLWVVQVWWTW